METKHVNRTYLIGNLGRDPESRTIASGNKVTKFSLAISDDYKDKKTDEWVKRPAIWVDCECWGAAADDAEANLKKGSRISLSGKLRLEQWDDKTTGQKRSKLSVNIYEFEVEAKRGGEGDGADGGEPRAATSQASSGGEIPF